MTEKVITVIIRDMFVPGTETVELRGKIADAYLASSDKSNFVKKIETVTFEHPYIAGRF